MVGVAAARRKIRRSAGSVAFDMANYVFLALVGLSMLYPFYYIFIVSISSGDAVIDDRVSLYPIGLSLKTYEVVFNDRYILVAYKNTLLYTTVGTCVNLAFTSLCAYPLSKKRFYGRKLFVALIVFTMFFQGGIIPTYLLVQKLRMLNTVWSLALPVGIITWYMIIMRTFFQSIPASLEESAFIDGANDLRIFVAIYLPLSTAIMATMTLFYSVYHWNSYFHALIYLSKKRLYPLQLILRNIVIMGEIGRGGQEQVGEMTTVIVLDKTIKYAVIMVATVPILLVYPFVQRYFIKGIMVGSLKG